LGITERGFQLVEHIDDLFQAYPFASQFLGLFRVIPDIGVFQLADDFGQAFILGIIVKDTPSGFLSDPAYP
jgi:hypothetical protein